MKIGLAGYQGSGKTTLFEWLTGQAADPALAHLGQSAMAPLPDARIDPLCQIYSPKKITRAALEIVDTPGLSRTHEGNAARLGTIREAGCLVLVVAGFGGADPLVELQRFREDLLLADLEIVSGRVERLADSVKKPRPNREQELAELAALREVQTAMEAGKPLAASQMNEAQLKATRSFRLLTEKPTLVVLNLADDAQDLDGYGTHTTDGTPLAVVRGGLELELARMSPADREEMMRDLGVGGADRDALLLRILDTAGYMLYFTAGEKEVRTWLLTKGGTALQAADNIHSDLARGFIRAEVMRCEDLIRLGSERDVKAQNLVRQEPKDYVVQDGDILHVKFSV